jgi:hypothetical protein
VLLALVDMVGLDVVSLLMLFELRHYVGVVYKMTVVPVLRSVYSMGMIPVPEPYSRAYRGHPVLRSYVMLWPLVTIVAMPLFIVAMALAPWRGRGPS